MSTQPPVTVVNTGIISNIGCFNINDDWDLFNERLEQYFLANRIDEERKVPVLLTSVNESVYKVLKNLCDPDKPASKNYKELVKLLSEQFKPKRAVYRKRILFDSLRQSNETIREWYVKVKTLAAECEFGTSLTDRVKDKFVVGMRPGRILDRLCEERIDKPLSDLLEIAQNKEVFLQEERQIEVNRVQQTKKIPAFRREGNGSKNKFKPKKENGNKSTEEEAKCYHCGQGKHDFKKCKFKDYTCNNCKKKGHIVKVCKYKVGTNSIEQDDNAFLDMFNVDVSYVNAISVNVLINDQPVKMELDTGAGMSCMPLQYYKKTF